MLRAFATAGRSTAAQAAKAAAQAKAKMKRNNQATSAAAARRRSLTAAHDQTRALQQTLFSVDGGRLQRAGAGADSAEQHRRKVVADAWSRFCAEQRQQDGTRLFHFLRSKARAAAELEAVAPEVAGSSLSYDSPAPFRRWPTEHAPETLPFFH